MHKPAAQMNPRIRLARIEDAEFVLDLCDMASHGFLDIYFDRLLPAGADKHACKLARVRETLSKMSYTKCRIAEVNGRPAGLVNLDPIQLDPAPPDPDLPAMFQPLAELEAQSPGTTVIEFLATLPEYRGRGVGRALLKRAEAERGPNGLSLIVTDNNTGARAVYDRAGFVEVARRPIVHDGWDSPGREWILMHRAGPVRWPRTQAAASGEPEPALPQ